MDWYLDQDKTKGGIPISPGCIYKILNLSIQNNSQKKVKVLRLNLN